METVPPTLLNFSVQLKGKFVANHELSKQIYRAYFVRVSEYDCSRSEAWPRSWPISASPWPISGTVWDAGGGFQEPARSALECGGLTPPWDRQGLPSMGAWRKGGVKPPHSKAPAAQARVLRLKAHSDA